MASKINLKDQFRRNAVAIISLAVAVTGLGYNTWRNEVSEHNRNQRLIAIQILVMLGEFQQVVLDRRHDKQSDGESARRKGWALARTVRDIAMIAEGGVPQSTERLFEVWQRDSDSLRPDENTREAREAAGAAQKAIEAAIDAVRRDTHAILRRLD